MQFLPSSSLLAVMNHDRGSSRRRRPTGLRDLMDTPGRHEFYRPGGFWKVIVLLPAWPRRRRRRCRRRGRRPPRGDPAGGEARARGGDQEQAEPGEDEERQRNRAGVAGADLVGDHRNEALLLLV